MNYNREDVPLDIIDYIDELKSQHENKAFELTGAQTEIWRLEAIEKQQQEQIAQLREALRGVMGIVGDSRGVAGYHLNGAIAEWDEFDEITQAEKALGWKDACNG